MFSAEQTRGWGSDPLEEEADRMYCLGPDAVLVLSPGTAPMPGRAAGDWMVELFQPGGDTVRVVFAEGGAA